MTEPLSYRVKFTLRRMWHAVYPWTALIGLDRKLLKYLPGRNGVFIEAGANDGLQQSNTFYLEKRRGWTGLLIEPVPRLARRCRRVRRRAQVVETILVANGHEGQMVEILDLDLMTLVPEQPEGLLDAEKHTAVAESVQRITREKLTVTGATLSSVIDSTLSAPVDLLSLDVEGFELDVLKGLDFERHATSVIVVETRVIERIAEFLSPRYELAEALSHHDYLFVRQHEEQP